MYAPVFTRWPYSAAISTKEALEGSMSLTRQVKLYGPLSDVPVTRTTGFSEVESAVYSA